MALKPIFQYLFFPDNVSLCVVFLRTRVLFVLLCNAVARGLIQPLCGPYSIALPGDKSKSKAEKGMEKAASVLGFFLEPAALQDVRKALEVC